MTTVQQQAAYEMESVNISVDDRSGKKGKNLGERSYAFGLIKIGSDETLTWRLFQILMWFVLVGTITFAPIMMKFANLMEDGTTSSDKFMGPTAHTISFFISTVVGIVLTGIIHGKQGIQLIFKLKSILLLAPVSIGYVVSEALALFAMAQCDPIMYAVIHKMRLLETALFTKIFLKRKVTIIQWVTCFTVTSCVLAYVFQGEQKKAHGDISPWLGPLILLLNITISTICAILADFIYKIVGYSLAIQMACGRITATAGSLILSVVWISYKGWWHHGFFGGPLGGWDGRVVGFTFFLVFRDWITCFILLHQDALWKALAGSAAVCTTYLCDCWLRGQPFVLSRFMSVLSIMFTVAIYALIKVLEKELFKLRGEVKDMKKKALVCGENDTPLSDTTTA